MTSLHQILTTITEGAEDDTAYIIAVAINAYSESRRRLFGRVLFTPNDVRAVASLVATLLTDTPMDKLLAPPRSRELTEGEQKELLESGVERRV